MVHPDTPILIRYWPLVFKQYIILSKFMCLHKYVIPASLMFAHSMLTSHFGEMGYTMKQHLLCLKCYVALAILF